MVKTKENCDEIITELLNNEDKLNQMRKNTESLAKRTQQWIFVEQYLYNKNPDNFRVLYFYNCTLPSNALLNVTSSVYSKSPPTGTPCAILVTFIPNGFISFDKYIAVASPSTLGFVASITSFTLPFIKRARSSFTFMSSGQRHSSEILTHVAHDILP